MYGDLGANLNGKFLVDGDAIWRIVGIDEDRDTDGSCVTVAICMNEATSEIALIALEDIRLGHARVYAELERAQSALADAKAEAA